MHTHSLPLKSSKTLSGVKAAVLTYVKTVFTLDLRALAALRIAVSATLLIDLYLRMGDIRAHYTDEGILPLEALLKHAWSPYSFSIYNVATGFQLQLLLMLVNFICGCCLLIGYRTRLFTFICWLFLLSIHNRNPLIHQGGDDLLRMAMFWGMFLPWGYYYSADSRKVFNSAHKPVNYLAFAGAAYLLQIIIVYFFSALLKSGPEWTSEYTALYYAFSLDQIALPVSKYFYHYPLFLKIVTVVVYYMELLFPLALLIPVYNPKLRMLFFIVFAAFHMGIALCLNVGIFPLVAIVVMIGLLPGKFITYAVEQLNKLTAGLQNEFKSLLPTSTPGKAVYVPKETLLQTAAVVLLFIYIIANNRATIGQPSIISKSLAQAGLALRVQQNWGMFAPSVYKDDGWFVFSGNTAAGKTIDIAKEGEKVHYAKPAYVAGMATYQKDRWRKYHENILSADKSVFRGYYCNYLLNKWNNSHEKAQNITSLKIYYMKEVSLPDYKRSIPVKEELCGCGK